MAALFEALPVGQGDSFLVTLEEFALLIDGGKSRRALPKILGPLERLNAIACTHNDADHANGLIGLLRSPHPAPREVWLPGSWTSNLRDMLSDGAELVARLMTEVHEQPEAWFSPEEHRKELSREHDRAIEGRLTEHVLDEAIGALVDEPPLEKLSGHFWPLFWRPWLGNSPRTAILAEALHAAERIRSLASLAWYRGCRIRWLDTFKAPTSLNARVRCINAGESPVIHPPVESLLAFLRLTTENRNSLCFEVSETNDHPAIIFTADSDLSFNHPINWGRKPLITAPHHGAEANAGAYARVAQECPSRTRTWVRSDGAFRKNPGQAYLAQRSPDVSMYCTRCRPDYQVQRVRVFASLDSWGSPSRLCTCS